MANIDQYIEKQINTLISRLPAKPGIMGKEKYFSSAVLIPIIKLEDSHYFLFQKRAAGIRQGGEICFPGGEIDSDLDATPLDAALRETEEEMGLNKSQIKVLGSLDTLVASMGAIIYPTVAIIEIASLDDLTINPAEVEKAFVIPIEYFKENPAQKHKIRLEVQPSFYSEKEGVEEVFLPAKKLNLPKRYHKPWGGKLYPVYVYQPPEGVIWGITAELIREVLEKLSL